MDGGAKLNLRAFFDQRQDYFTIPILPHNIDSLVGIERNRSNNTRDGAHRPYFTIQAATFARLSARSKMPGCFFWIQSSTFFMDLWRLTRMQDRTLFSLALTRFFDMALFYQLRKIPSPSR
jgi:hypothetical protein